MAFHTPGGGEMQLLAYKNSLIRQGIDVKLFDPWDPQFHGCDIFHFFSCIGGSTHLCRFAKSLGIPLVVSSSLWITEATKSLYPVEEIKQQLELADRIIVNSLTEKKQLAKLLAISEQNFSVVYNGISNSFFKQANPALFRNKFSISQPFILNVANIEPRKNQLLLAEAVKQFPSYQLVLIGHVRDTEYYARVIQTNPEQIQYVGSLPNDSSELTSAYSACAVLALPSTLETPGLSALEAAAQGAKIIVTTEGCCGEYFGENALYVRPNHEEDLIKALSTALLPNFDCNASAANIFTWDEVTTQLIKVYRSLKHNNQPNES